MASNGNPFPRFAAVVYAPTGAAGTVVKVDGVFCVVRFDTGKVKACHYRNLLNLPIGKSC